jgi:membrane protease subunit HflC
VAVRRRSASRRRPDREVTETIAAAQRDAEIIRGQGEAERNATFATAFQRDPEFFEFYRSMNAYLSALSGNGTTMVLSPDSEFFRFFKDAAGAVASPAPAASAQ